MKKVLVYFSVFIFVCFLLPAFLTKRDVKTTANGEEKEEQENRVASGEYNNEEQSTNKENGESNIKENYQYKNYANIKLVHTKTNEVEEVPLDEYLCNVVSAEMPADFELEALKAQAIVARTYTIYKMKNRKHNNGDICDDSNCCQAWISKDDRLAKWEESKRESNWKKIVQSVYDTKGKVITYQNKPINAFFHSNSGGTTELPVNVWGGGSNMPYLQAVETSGEEGYSQYSSEVIISEVELLNKLKEKYNDIQIDFTKEDDIKIIEFTDSGRVRTVKFGNHNISGVEARTLFKLKSTNFEIKKEGCNIKFTVKGYGHGVGMSQTGADSMAKEGKNCEDIIHHFYVGVEIKDFNSI